MSLLQMIKQANRPGPPEDSVLFRVAATGAVVTSIVACWAEGELSAAVAGGALVAVAAGNVLSYRRRTRPVPHLKLTLALAVMVAFAWFFISVSANAASGNLASVEGPLAVLFTAVQVTHAFDVPSRRDLGFSLAGSATLMAVAAAQSVGDLYAVYVVVWAAFAMGGLLCMSASQTGGGRVRPVVAVAAGTCVVVVGVLVVAVLPAPHADSSFILPSVIAGDLPLSQAAALVGGGPRGNEPVHAATPCGRTGIGGFLGFAGPLTTAVRASLGTQLVFRVRADRPTFWVAETFFRWSGQAWVQPTPPKGTAPWHTLSTTSPFLVPVPAGERNRGTSDYQTFYLAQSGPNLVFHAANATEVWFPSRHLYVSPYGTVRTGTSMGPGSVYTVLSKVNTATPAELAAPPPATGAEGRLTGWERAQALQLPHPYPRVAALARRITAHAHTTDQKVLALERWMGTHTKYTLDIPPLAPGQDTVEQFLFGTHRGYCEQISTSLAVMLRTLGVPAREATGYVPGPYDPITDLYQVRADDAHAWVQVYFPGYGWQSFDPTAFVPLANPSPAGVLAHDALALAKRVPWAPVGGSVALILGVLLVVAVRRRTPATWAGAVGAQIVASAKRAGIANEPGDTLGALAARIDARRDDRPGDRSDDQRPGSADPSAPDARRLAAVAERAAFGGAEPDARTRRELLASARRLRRRARKLRRPPAARGVSGPRGGSGPRRRSPRPPATVGTPSKDAGG